MDKGLSLFTITIINLLLMVTPSYYFSVDLRADINNAFKRAINEGLITTEERDKVYAELRKCGIQPNELPRLRGKLPDITG